jgi:RNA polymerase sigma-70 factor (ECF subfamily)
MIPTMNRSGSRKSRFEDDLRRHQTQIFGFIYSLVRNFDDADDLFQQTSLVLWRKYDRYDATKSFVAWACGVARLEVADFVRRSNRRRRHFGGSLSELLIDVHAEFEAEYEHIEERQGVLAACMKKLRQRDQELIQACYGGSARVPEVARAWGRSIQSVHNSLSRIRRTLLECVRRTMGKELLG